MIQAIILIILLVLFLICARYMAKKQIAYQNDERWNHIKIQADKVSNYYWKIIFVLIAISIIYISLNDVHYTISIMTVLIVSYCIIIFETIINTIATIFYNKKN